MDQKLRQRLKAISQYRSALPPTAEIRSQVEFRSPLDPSHGNPPPVAYDLKPPSLSQDASLNALAQLAALRSNSERAFISITDDKTQHILAEATRSISFFDRTLHDAGDGLCLGLQSLPSQTGGCPSSIRIFSGEPDVVLHGSGSRADESCIIITDVAQALASHDFPLLSYLPKSIQYYLEVPLKTESGHVLGSICVVDSVLHELAPFDIPRLQEVADLVLQHLKSRTVREDQRRAERLMQGLAHFVRGHSSLSLWSQTAPDQHLIPALVQESTNLSMANLQRERSDRDPAEPQNLTNADGEADSANTTVVTTTSPNPNSATTQTVMPSTRTKTGLSEADLSEKSSVQVEVGFDPLIDEKGTDPMNAATLSSVNIRHAFSRASNLIRESLDLDATSFLEVPQNERYKSMNSNRARDRKSQELESSATEDSELSNNSSSEALSEEPNKNSSTDSVPATTVDDSLCHRLGYSTRLKSSLAKSSATQRFMTIPARLLNKLAAKYPEGRIFHFDLGGGLSSSEEDKKLSRNHKAGLQRTNKIAQDLSNLFPVARSLIFLPLYDNSRQHVYAGFLGWTANPARYLQKHEIVYISGFANSVMCEVMRLGAIATDKAKSDFISSISHELRSPLHGILAAGQLLSESQLDREQGSYVQMVENCAHTLLDIMNHLLDHAKINQFRERQAQGQAQRPKPKAIGTSRSETYSLVSSMDVSLVVEETASSMAFPGRISADKDLPMSPVQSPLNSTLGFTAREQSLSIPIILHIQPNQDWTVNSEPGSWRRIIMNLVGNSLKYTQKGHIELSLQLNPHVSSPGEKSKCIVELKVKDTGQGISEDYLKHRLYTPFTQEDNLSVGAGLGLSLVKQIVSSLHGQIHVQSEVGAGTEITVRIPVERSEAALSTKPQSELLPMTKDKTIACFGFDSHPSLSEDPTGILDSHAAALLSLKHSIQGYARDWFEMKTILSHPDIYIIEGAHLDMHIADFDHPDHRILVIGMDNKNLPNKRLNHAEYTYMLPPVGPKQLGEAFRGLIEAELSKRIKPTAAQAASTAPPDPRPLATRSKSALPRGQITKSLANFPHKSSSDSGKVTDEPRVADSSSNDASDKTEPPATAEATIATSASRKRVVLLVDDNDINLRLLVACANRMEHVEYITATNGKEALDKYQSTTDNGTKIDAVFMDISMPVMNGFESARQIRAYEKTKGMSRIERTKIIALTGLASAEAQDQVDESGFDVYLRKPVNLKILREMLSD